MADLTKQLAQSKEFAVALGLFYINWTKVELLIDCAISVSLNISATQTHLITASIDFGRRAQWLRALIVEKKPKEQGKILRALNSIQNDSKRNVFAHSYLSSGETSVTFVERVPFGRFTIKTHRYDWNGFKAHVDGIANHCAALQEALGISDSELSSFAQVAISMASKRTVSPDPPNDNAE
jgi:hypothetical protein